MSHSLISAVLDQPLAEQLVLARLRLGEHGDDLFADATEPAIDEDLAEPRAARVDAVVGGAARPTAPLDRRGSRVRRRVALRSFTRTPTRCRDESSMSLG